MTKLTYPETDATRQARAIIAQIKASGIQPKYVARHIGLTYNALWLMTKPEPERNVTPRTLERLTVLRDGLLQIKWLTP